MGSSVIRPASRPLAAWRRPGRSSRRAAPGPCGTRWSAGGPAGGGAWGAVRGPGLPPSPAVRRDHAEPRHPPAGPGGADRGRHHAPLQLPRGRAERGELRPRPRRGGGRPGGAGVPPRARPLAPAPPLRLLLRGLGLGAGGRRGGRGGAAAGRAGGPLGRAGRPPRSLPGAGGPLAGGGGAGRAGRVWDTAGGGAVADRVGRAAQAGDGARGDPPVHRRAARRWSARRSRRWAG